ncbi:acyl carrier protein [Streptomyces sp. NBC_01352]|uniref:acyl carrier protein n=1 Tax=unclassified Streptomyces TaxID=2593676 RepID=UPI00225A74E2|nr:MULTISPECIES: acyl carrier protein [unclassified Streptomyces]MCX4706085.1 acyl carrier protein [Streptomyces sp. NBC_01373]
MSIAPTTHTAPARRPVERSVPHGNVPDLDLWLTERVAFHLHRAPDEVDPDTPLADYGIDSVAAISICGEIEERYRLPVAPTIAYDFPTVHAITGHLAERLADKAKHDEAPS